MPDEKQILGAMPLFLGIETQDPAKWPLARFTQAANEAKALGVTSLLIKIADGGLPLWYSSIGGWQKVLDTVKATGIGAIPYTYCYGDKFDAISTEIAYLINAMKYSGIVIANMEKEFNDQVAWAQRIAGAMQPVPGLFGVCSWANPLGQNWGGVLQALAPAANFLMPQVYSDYLAGIYQAQHAPYKLPVYPVLLLGTLTGTTNNPVAIAQASKSPVVGFWEYQDIGKYPNVIGKIATMLKGATTMSGVPAGWMDRSSVLSAPNGHTVVLGFRDYILDNGNWPADLVPIEQELPDGSGGTFQVFSSATTSAILTWTKDGVKLGNLAQLYLAAMTTLQAPNPLLIKYASLLKQIAALATIASS